MASVIRGTDNFDSKPYASFPIGVPFLIWDHFAPVIVPDNTGDIKFIKLTAGDSYNDGLLENEVIGGSAPLVEATAEISVGPLAGLEVHLVNTERRYLMPGESPGTVADDQMQQITGTAPGGRARDGTFDGAFTDGGAYDGGFGSDASKGYVLDFDSADSPDARTGDHTNVKHIESTYYMRIQ